MKIINLTKDTLVADEVTIADNFLSRTKGLLGKNALKENEALVIKPCNAIHTFFMRFSIDAVFLDKQNKVVAIKENLRPFKITPIYPKAFLVIELPIGKISNSSIQPNDQIKFE